MIACCVCLEDASHLFAGAPVCGESHARSFYASMRVTDRTMVNSGRALSELKVRYYTLGAAFDLDNPKRVFDLSKDYTNFVRIGRGGNASIYRATSVQSGRTYALKVFTPVRSANTARQDFVNLLELRHRIIDDYQDEAMLRNLPEVYDAFRATTPFYSNPSFVVKMEYIQGRSLNEYMNAAENVRESIDVYSWFEFALSAFDLLQTMHTIGMVHGDIKGDNIMVRQSDPDVVELKHLAKNFVLIDFGLSCAENECDKHVTGTVTFMGPDLIGYPYARDFSNQLRNLPSKTRLSMFMAEDVYALATTLFNAIAAVDMSPLQRLVKQAMKDQENLPFNDPDRDAVDDMNRRRREAAVALFTPHELHKSLKWILHQNPKLRTYKMFVRQIYDVTVAKRFNDRANAMDTMFLIRKLRRQII